MIALSSFRPLAQCSVSRQHDFIIAKLSWDVVFDQIHYFNALEPQLATSSTIFIAREQPDERPSIALMAEHAAQLPGWTALINADIIVSKKLSLMPFILDGQHVCCALSRRWRTPSDNQPIDWGLDFFLAKSMVWKTVAAQVPKDFLMGKIRWDTWLCSFWCHRYDTHCADLTASRLIYHYDHNERGDQHLKDPDDFYLRNPRYPRRRIVIA